MAGHPVEIGGYDQPTSEGRSHVDEACTSVEVECATCSVQIDGSRDGCRRRGYRDDRAAGGAGRIRIDGVIPAAAVPYLGNGLDLSLFDVDALLEQQRDGRIPVRIAYRGGQPTLPGVTLTSAGGSTAEGYLTGSSARDFGAALVRQYLDDRGVRGYGSRGMFAGGTSVSLAGSAGGGKVRPRYDMHTLTLTATDASGAPVEGDPVLVYNVDDSFRFGDPFESVGYFADGTARFSVPEGRYAALSLFLSTDGTGAVTGVRLVSRPEFAVSADLTVPVDAREANSRVTMVTPRPAVPQEGGFVFRRAAATGPSLYLDVATEPGVPVWVAPTHEPVRVGTLDTYPYQRLTSPPGPGLGYEYQLQYAAGGVIPAQRYVVRPDSLATIDANYYSEVPSPTGVRQRAGSYPFEFHEVVSRGGHPLKFPRHQTEYVSGDASVTWFGGMGKYSTDGGFAWYGGQNQALHSYRPGQRLREDWNRFPLHPAGDVNLLGPDSTRSFTVSPVTRAGDTVRIHLTPFSDNQPGHTGFGFYGQAQDTITGAYEIYQDGTPIAAGDPSGSGLGLDTQVTLGPGASTVRLVLDATRDGPMYSLSTGSHTEWTWRSAHQQGSTLPQGLVCRFNRGGPPDRDCAVEPLLTLAYAVDGMRVDGSVPAGVQGLNLTVGHLQQASAAPVTGATVEYSLDDGATWRKTAVRPRVDGTFRAASATPGAGRYVSLRVTAADGAGGRISETVRRAYRLAR
jgi:hypothetical protein